MEVDSVKTITWKSCFERSSDLRGGAVRSEGEDVGGRGVLSWGSCSVSLFAVNAGTAGWGGAGGGVGSIDRKARGTRPSFPSKRLRTYKTHWPSAPSVQCKTSTLAPQYHGHWSDRHLNKRTLWLVYNQLSMKWDTCTSPHSKLNSKSVWLQIIHKTLPFIEMKRKINAFIVELLRLWRLRLRTSDHF